MGKLLVLKENIQEVDGRMRVINPQAIFFCKDTTRPFNTKWGNIVVEDLQKEVGTYVTTSSGKTFLLLEPGFTDLAKRMKRVPQSMINKDIGFIIAESGISKNSIVVDAGLGNGALAAALGNICKQVVSYEVQETHITNAKKNLNLVDVKNVEIKHASVYDGIDETEVDVVTLDVPEPWRALEHAAQALKLGGFLVTYSPSTTQIKRTTEEALAGRFIRHKTVEIIERKWKIKGESVRPDNVEIGHTAFLSFFRKFK
jgi:tRNA (adenine57-N1/adenine58-N1)-methyltransferase catalytic subunit